MITLLQKIKSYRRPSVDMVFEKLLKSKQISKKQYHMLQELRTAWQNGDIANGSHVIADEIFQTLGVDVAPTTLRRWLGRKNVNQK